MFYKLKKKFIKKSYSQCGEDLIIKFMFDSIKIYKPSFIDIGAHHPYYLNNTALFYSNGSRGINIEPDPSLFKLFTKYRKEDINLNIGVDVKDGMRELFLINTPTLNTFSEEEVENYKLEGNYSVNGKVNVEVLSIESVLKKYFNGQFPQFLTLDAEGVDWIVLNSIDFEKKFPIIICVETITFSENKTGVKKIEIINYLVEKGYIHYADTYINSIFIKKDYWK